MKEQWLCALALAWSAGAVFWILMLHGEVKRLRAKIEKLTRTPASTSEETADEDPDKLERPGPLRLTDLGRNIADHMNAENWARTIAERLRVDARNREPFQVDAMAQQYLDDHGAREMKRDNLHSAMDLDLHDRISETAYSFGRERDAIVNTLRVVLRDELLKPEPQSKGTS